MLDGHPVVRADMEIETPPGGLTAEAVLVGLISLFERCLVDLRRTKEGEEPDIVEAIEEALANPKTPE